MALKPTDFTATAPGRLVPLTGTYTAYVPHPLPPRLEYTGPMMVLLEEATLALGQLSGIGETLPNPHMLIKAFQQREALLSSRIEGTIADQRDLLFADLAKPKELTTSVREVQNYVYALRVGLRKLKDLPVCLRLIREVHQRLMRGARGYEQRPGEFRDVQNYVGKPGGFQNARYIPPPVTEMHESLVLFEKALHNQVQIPALIRLALLHYQFEAIHPFRDGNGRVGRLLISLLLCDWKLLSKPLLYLSAYFDHHREEYFDHLLDVSKGGTWNAWISFFLKGVAEQSRDAIDRAQRLLALRDKYREKLKTAHAPGSCLHLIDRLFEVPALTIPSAADHLSLGYPSAKRNVLKLVVAGILEETAKKQHPKLYLAPGILELVSAF
jgi:Fic family protein